jgi:hypothetical protein
VKGFFRDHLNHLNQPINAYYNTVLQEWRWIAEGPDTDSGGRLHCPYGEPGDRLWVRETWWHYRSNEIEMVSFPGWTGTRIDDRTHWETRNVSFDPSAHAIWKKRPSIHMPRWASRLTLEITGVRVERVQTISEEDAIAEGCFDEKEHDGSLPSQIYRQLWDALNAKRGYSWESNPFVWVLSFRQVTQ